MSSPRPRRKRALALTGAAGIVSAAMVAAPPALAGPGDETEAARTAVTIGIDPSYQGPEWEGWGASLVWSGNATGGYPEEIRQQLVDMTFGDDGLNLNIARYNIGGGNAPNINRDYMKVGADMDGFWAAPEGTTHEDKDWWDPENPEHWNWDADANQRWWIDQIKDDVTHWEAFSNSPPYFQTVSGYVSGGFDSSQDQIRIDTVDQFAIYLTEVMDHLENEHGIEFDTVNPLNEPNTPYWGTTLGPDGVQPTGGRQEGAHAGPELQQLVIQALADQLTEAETEAVISAMDETNPGTFTTNWNAYTAESRAVVDQMNVHTYGTGGRTGVRDLAKGEDKTLWMSEVEGSFHSPTDYETMATGLGIADRIVDDLRELEPSAWVFWQPIEDTIPQQAGGGNWGSIHIPFNCTAQDTLETCPIKTNTKYDTIRNFTHYIEPGDHFVGVDDPDSAVAISPEGDGATLVHVNAESGAREVTIDLSRFGSVAEEAQVTPVVSSADGGLVEGRPTAVEGTTATLTVPGESVTTFVIEGVVGIAADAAHFQDGHVYRFDGIASDKSIAPSDDGTGIVLREDDADDAEHLWQVEHLSDGVSNRERYQIVNAGTGTRLAVSENLAMLETAEGDPDEYAQWILSTTGDGSYVLLNVGSGRVLDVWGQSTEDGAPVQTYTPTASDNQRWVALDETVLDVAVYETYTVPGHTPELPDTVEAVRTDGVRGTVPVTWKMPHPYHWYLIRTVVVLGEAVDAQGNTFTAKAKVRVDIFWDTEPAEAATYEGGVPELPETVTAVGLRRTEVELPVTWDEAPEGAFDQVGEVTVTGTAELIDGTELDAEVVVTVTEPIEVNAALDGDVATEATYTEPGYGGTAGLINGNLTDKAWSNWVSGDKRTEDTVTFTLPTERDVTRVVSHFYRDGSTPSFAEELQVQYTDANGEWVDAGEPVRVGTDGSPVIDVEVDQRTSAVRILMTVGEAGWIVMSEVEIFAKAPNV